MRQRNFLQRWDFHEWKQKYRLSEKIKPTDKLCRFFFNDGDDVRVRLL